MGFFKGLNQKEFVIYTERLIYIVCFCVVMFVIVLFLKLMPLWYYSPYVKWHCSWFSEVVKFVSFQPESTSGAFEIGVINYPYF